MSKIFVGRNGKLCVKRRNQDYIPRECYSEKDLYKVTKDGTKCYDLTYLFSQGERTDV